MEKRTEITSVVSVSKPTASLPAWMEFNELEQTFLVVLSQQKAAKTWWELYRETAKTIIRIMGKRNFKALKQASPITLERIAEGSGDLNRMLEFYRGKGIELPSQKTFKNIISFFEYVGWIGATERGEGRKRIKKLYFANHALIEKLKLDINKFIEDNAIS